MAFRTLQQEADLIDTLVSTGRCAVDVIGESVEGRPIRLLRMGDPPPAVGARPAVLLVGMQHGLEPAGREAILDFADYLSTTVDSGELAFLASHGVHLIPSVNPDGFEAVTRENANGEDLNRDWVVLTQPETRVVSLTVGQLKPMILVDHHEYVGTVDRNDLECNRGGNPQIHDDIVAHGSALRDQILGRMTTEGWSNDHWGPDDRGDLIVLDINSSLRHIVSIIIETNRTGTPSEADRTTMHYQAIEEILDFTITNVATIETDIDGAIADKIAEGAAGVAPFDIRGGNVLDPPPLGYRITGVLPNFHLQAFGLVVQGSVVSMAQAAQPLIPYLFDPLSEVLVATGVRLFGLSAPAVVADVVEFAEVVHGSHQPTFEARVLTSFQDGADPVGATIPVLGGDVQFDATAAVFASLQLITAGVDEDETGESRFPRLVTDLLAPYGNEIWARRGVDVGDAVLWSPLGYFRIDSAEQADAPYGELSLSGQDRMAGLIDARLVTTRSFAPNTSVASVFAVMVGEVYPQATIVFDDDTGFADIDRRVMFEEDRYAPLAELAQAFGKIMYWDGEGVLRIESAPDESVPLWEVKAGTDGVLVSAGRRVNREGVFNGVVARGEGGDQQDPVFAAAVDIGPNSPTRWGGRFGKVPRFYASPFIKTEAQALSTARAMLRRRLGAPHSADFGTVANPALRPWHPIRVTQRDGNREIHVVQSVTIPLNADGTMSGTTRERTQVLIGRVTS
jgi:hypothetical protein